MKKIFLLISTFFSIILLMTACDGEIFSTIREEVELEDAQVSGDINSIVRFTLNGKEYLFVDSGNIWYKDVDAAAQGSPTMTAPFGGQWAQAAKTGIDASHIIRVAADSTYLYALGGKVEANNDSGYMEPVAKKLYYSTDGAIWTAITIGDSENIPVYSSTTLFCTNTPQNAHRKAYLNIAGTLYELAGQTATEMTIGEVNLSTTPTKSSISAAYYNGNVYFSSSAIISNETLTEDATLLFRADDDYVYYLNTATDEDDTGDTQNDTNGDTTETTADSAEESSDDATATDTLTWVRGVDAEYTIYSIAYTASHLLLGTRKGLIYNTISATTGLPTTDIDSDAGKTTSATSTLSSSYRVYTVFAVDPSLPAKGGDLYGTTVYSGSSSSTSATSENEGLWGFYPGRDGGKWNRE